MNTKYCSKCKTDKPKESFCKDSHCRDLLAFYCRECQRARNKRYGQSENGRKQKCKYNKEWQHKNPQRVRSFQQKYCLSKKGSTTRKECYSRWAKSESGKQYFKARRIARKDQGAAHDAIKRAVRNGKIIRPNNCSKCGANGIIEGHHHLGYAKENWLNVQWLCIKCHRAITPTRELKSP